MKIITVSACLVVSVLADSLAARQSAPFIGSPGFGSPGSISSPSVVKDSTQQLFESAGRSPNETSSASFIFFPGNVSSPESNITWSWRVNITDVVIPEQVSPGGLHVVNEQWQLQWPEGGSLESYMARSGIDGTFSTSLCLSAGVFTLPSNVTSRISESNRNNCSEILGSECVRGILQSGFPGCEGSGFRTPMACMDTLGVAISSSSQSTNATSLGSFYSDDTFFHYTSPGVPIANVSATYAEAKARLNILQLQDIPRPGRGTYTGPLVCQVVNPEASSGAALRLGGRNVWMLLVTVGAVFVLL